MATTNNDAKPYLTLYCADLDHKDHSFTFFVSKLAFRLRYSGIVYEKTYGDRGDSPNRKVPFAKINDTGEVIADSTIITKRLVEYGKLPELNKDLTPAQRAADFCLRSMVEDKIQFLTMYENWLENYAVMRDEGPFSNFTGMKRHLVCNVVLLFCKAILWFQGTGRLSRDEVEGFRTEAIASLAAYATASKERADREGVAGPFWILGGDKPTEADFTVFGFLATNVVRRTAIKLATMIRQEEALMEYVKRIHKVYFADFKDIPESLD